MFIHTDNRQAAVKLPEDTILTIAPFDTYLAIASTECDPDEIITSKLDRDYIDE